MAKYDANILINVVTKGERRLNAVKASINELNRLSQNLKPINLLAPGGGKLGDSLRQAIKPIQDFAREATNGTQRYSNTLAGATGQAQTFKTVLDNVKIAAGGYEKQVAAVKAYADALAGAEAQAENLAKRQEDLLTDVRRREAGLQPQSERDIEVERRRQAINNARLKQEEKISKEKAQQRFLDERALRTAEKIAAIQNKARKRQQRTESLQLGVGFPLLFGGGPGSVAGGALGALSDSAGGFGGQILFSAIGQQIDEAVKKAADFGKAISNIDVATLENALGRVSDDLELQVKLLKEQGKLVEAQNLVQKEVTRQTGLTLSAAEDVSVAVGVLNTGFKELVNSASALLGIIGAPIAAAVGLILSLLGKAVALVNTLLSAGGRVIQILGSWVINLVAGEGAANRLGEAISKYAGSLDRSVTKAVELKLELVEAAEAAERALGLELSRSPFNDLEAKIIDVRIDAGKAFIDIQKNYEDAIKRVNALPENTLEQRIQKITAKAAALKARKDQEALVTLNATRKIEQLRAQDLKEQSREIEKQEALLRKIKNAEISRELAEDIFANQPAINTTPFNRTTPEQDRQSKLQLQQIKYAAEIDRINNSITNEQIKQDNLTEASVKNQLVRLNIERQFADTVRQRKENFLALQSSLQNQLNIQNATTRQQADQLRLQQEMLVLQRSGTFTEKQLQDIRNLKQALIDAQGPLKQFMTDTQRAINDLSDTEVQIVTAAQSIEREFGTAFQSIVTGTTSVQQAVSDMLLNIGRDFIAMATQIIAKQLVMITLQKTLGLFGGGGGGGGGFGAPVLTSGLDFSGAFADGGRPAVGKAALVGERGPELFVPNRSGTIIPNDQLGGSSNTVTVNVDAKGTEVSGNSDQSRQLGTAISRAVQAELVKQQRPGGVLHSSR